MADPNVATVEGPARKRSSWSIKTIVEDVAGVPISELQDPERPVHPYLQAKLAHSAADHPDAAEEFYDPIERVYPPLSGPTGRELHGPEHEHHAETIERHRVAPEPPVPGARVYPPGPSRRPERIYLHYLLLHLDRLSDTALHYLKHAVDEELQHRQD